jgi:hypothetical protein
MMSMQPCKVGIREDGERVEVGFLVEKWEVVSCQVQTKKER